MVRARNRPVRHGYRRDGAYSRRTRRPLRRPNELSHGAFIARTPSSGPVLQGVDNALTCEFRPPQTAKSRRICVRYVEGVGFESVQRSDWAVPPSVARSLDYLKGLTPTPFCMSGLPLPPSARLSDGQSTSATGEWVSSSSTYRSQHPHTQSAGIRSSRAQALPSGCRRFERGGGARQRTPWRSPVTTR